MARTGAVARTSAETRARTRASQIRTKMVEVGASLEDIRLLIADTIEQGDAEALGYPNWAAYFKGEFGTVKLPVEVRRALLPDLQALGLPQGAIAAIAGVSRGQISQDINRQVDSNYQPDGAVDGDVLEAIEPLRVIGADGKSYAARVVKPRPPVILPDDVEAANALVKAEFEAVDAEMSAGLAEWMALADAARDLAQRLMEPFGDGMTADLRDELLAEIPQVRTTVDAFDAALRSWS